MPLSPMLKKLLFVRQFDIDKGKISLLGDREIMLHASALLELQEIDESKTYQAAKQSSLRQLASAVEHAKVYGRVRDVFIKEIAQLGRKIGQTDEGTVRTLQEIFNVYGLGEMSIQNLDNSKKEALIVVKESTMADEFRARVKKRPTKPVCAITAGVLAGMFSYIFGKEVECVEMKCRALGNGYCLFKTG